MPLDDKNELLAHQQAVSGKRPRSSSSMVVFSAPQCQQLSAQRLAPVYVGVRRVRPSSRLVMMKAAKKTVEESNQPAAVVVYKVVADDGQERRMTAKEKKEAKWQEKLQAKKRKQETKEKNKEASASVASQQLPDQPDDRYVHLEVDPASLEQELADLRGDRDGVPPVMLPPELARLANLGGAQQQPDIVATPDDALAKCWAVALKNSMQPAETVRQGEDLRPMPYHLVPEVWSRMRPPETLSTNNETPVGPPDVITTSATMGNVSENADDGIRNDEWTFCQIRPNNRNDDAAAIVQLLHHSTKLHISCGAKFGCDYLLYDGPRNERHAFAGLRILPSCCSSANGETIQFPLPTAYDLAGYVRCLNTAGKLALLATVANDTSGQRRVLLVDLALEKIAVTASRRPRKTMEQRVKNLAKT